MLVRNSIITDTLNLRFYSLCFLQFYREHVKQCALCAYIYMMNDLSLFVTGGQDMDQYIATNNSYSKSNCWISQGTSLFALTLSLHTVMPYMTADCWMTLYINGVPELTIHYICQIQWPALDEINAGACDGMTYEEIKKNMPEEYEYVIDLYLPLLGTHPFLLIH